MPMIVMPNQEVIDEAFQPYLLAVGRVAHSWNYLHERLGQLFASVFGGDCRVALAVWYTVDSDRLQRKMLKSAVNATGDKRLEGNIERIKDIEWIINEADKVADRRSNAIHGPCSISLGRGGLTISPAYFYGNPRAKKLIEKDILTEFRWCESASDTLSRFTKDVERALVVGSAWPERPAVSGLSKKNKNTR